MFTPCHVKHISLNCFWTRFSVAAVNEVGEGPEAESSITTLSSTGTTWECRFCYSGTEGVARVGSDLRARAHLVDPRTPPLLPKSTLSFGTWSTPVLDESHPVFDK